MIGEMTIIDEYGNGGLVVSRKDLKIVFKERGVTKVINFAPYILNDKIKQEEEKAIKESAKKQRPVEREIKMFNEFDVSLIIGVYFIGNSQSSQLKVTWLKKPQEKDILYFDLKELKPDLESFKDDPHL